jgi:hypothetical protein
MALEDFTLSDLLSDQIPEQVSRLQQGVSGHVGLRADSIQVMSHPTGR